MSGTFLGHPRGYMRLQIGGMLAWFGLLAVLVVLGVMPI